MHKPRVLRSSFEVLFPATSEVTAVPAKIFVGISVTHRTLGAAKGREWKSLICGDNEGFGLTGSYIKVQTYLLCCGLERREQGLGTKRSVRHENHVIRVSQTVNTCAVPRATVVVYHRSAVYRKVSKDGVHYNDKKIWCERVSLHDSA
jgi:hypothetical protein